MIINIYKPVDWTSFDVVKKIRGLIKEKKVGHAGTLDPFAEGVLVIGTGKDTKSLANISTTKKSYTATIKLGIETDTLDIEGRIIQKKDVPVLSSMQIENVLNSFIGNQSQIPPMYSAKKVKGKRLYKLARQGIELERQPKKVNIHAIDVLDTHLPEIDIEVHCSTGTYVRVLAHDIGERLGCGAHLKKLCRIAAEPFMLDNAVELSNV